MKRPFWPLLLLTGACVEDSGLPNVGPCADYPDGVYEYGQIGIGSCLAGPTDLEFLGDGNTLAVINANPWMDFTGGSALFLDFSALDESSPRNMVTDLAPRAVPLPSLSGEFAQVPGQNLMVVTNRLSEGGRTREETDQVFLLDTSDVAAPALSDRGTNGGSTVDVGFDPNAISVNSAGNQAWVLNRTAHSLSILDLAADELRVVSAGGDGTVEATDFVDADSNGSRASFSRLEAMEAEDVYPHSWTLTWDPGSLRAWMPVEGGAVRYTGNGEGLWERSNVQRELDVADTGGVLTTVNEPSFILDGSTIAHIFFVDQGMIRQAETLDILADWDFYAEPTLQPGADWDLILSGPQVVISEGVWYLFYDGGDGQTASIGVATSTDGLSFNRRGNGPIVSVDGASVEDPYVFWDPNLQHWRMYFTRVQDGLSSIGQAESQDLLNWTARSESYAPTTDVSRPTVGWFNGRYQMYVTAPDGEGWTLQELSSVDGYDWTDTGHRLPLEREDGIAMQWSGAGSFLMEDESGNVLTESIVPGGTLTSTTGGWMVSVATGYTTGAEDRGDLTANGVSLDAQVGDLYYFSVQDFTGISRIAVGALDSFGRPVPAQPIINPGDGFRSTGVSHAVVTETSTGYLMLFAGQSDSVTQIGRATSPDGIVWTVDPDAVLASVDTWDSAALEPGSIEVLADGSYRLWFTAFDGEQYRVGMAESADGVTWTRRAGPRYDWVFDSGAPGDWFDSGVRDPWVITAEDGTQHMWFSGFDGDIWQIGYAKRSSDSAEWQSAEDSEGSPRAVLPALLGSFGASGLQRPVVRPSETGWAMYLTGVDAGVERVGEALGRSPDRLVRRLYQPSLADSLGFRAVPETGEASLLLDVEVDAGLLMALGCTDTNLDEERGFLYVSCRLVPLVVVVDIRDDSTPTFVDHNYLQVEAVVVTETSSTGGKTGWRSAVRDPQRDWLWGLGDAPEALQAIDLSDIVDNAGLELIRRPFVAMLPLPRSGDRDQGAETEAWVGPSDAVVHPDGKTLFVANFNDNSLSVFDLSLGPVGTLVGEVANLGENPYAISLTPDGKRAIVACYAGEVDDATVHSTLAVVDTDPESPTYLSTLTHIVNQEQTP